MSKPTTITLTEDPELKAKLRRKAAEYHERCGYTAPEVNPHEFFKYIMMKALVEEGTVDVDALRARYEVQDWFNDWAFQDATGIIQMYNAGMSHLVHGGTGLK